MEDKRIFSIEAAVKAIRDGIPGDYRIVMRGMYDIEKELEKFGYEHDPGDGDNTNGWEVDFGYRFKHPTEATLVVSGALWQRGNLYRIYKDGYYEEDTTEEV